MVLLSVREPRDHGGIKIDRSSGISSIPLHAGQLAGYRDRHVGGGVSLSTLAYAAPQASCQIGRHAGLAQWLRRPRHADGGSGSTCILGGTSKAWMPGKTGMRRKTGMPTSV